MKAKRERFYQVTAKTSSVCGWTVKAASVSEARILANSGPDWDNLDFDEPDSFEICKVTEKNNGRNQKTEDSNHDHNLGKLQGRRGGAD
jgi:hypothetical protein